jgi:hypothetical protein
VLATGIYLTSRYLNAFCARTPPPVRPDCEQAALAGREAVRRTEQMGNQLHAHSEAVGDEVAGLEVPGDDELRLAFVVPVAIVERVCAASFRGWDSNPQPWA